MSAFSVTRVLTVFGVILALVAVVSLSSCAGHSSKGTNTGDEDGLPGMTANPSPSDGATDVPVTAMLSWSAAGNADSYDVYFGTDETAIANADNTAPEFMGNQTGLSYDPPGNLAYEATYYWRIDSVNSVGITKGNVWSFTTEAEPTEPPEKVASPDPADGATDVPIYKVLSWGVASSADSYDVYLGTDETSVANADKSSSEFKGNQVELSYGPPGGLAYETTYYWRIDSVNAAGTTKGDVWSFTTEAPPAPWSWTRKDTSGPGKRWFHDMAWCGDGVVLFGGLSYEGTVTTFHNDTWIWDGSSWTELTLSTSPPARYGHTMCFDNQGALLFGGSLSDGSSTNDLWRFSDGTWTQINTSGDSPLGRHFHGMAYDSYRNVVVIFGGSDYAINDLSDTHELLLDASTWLPQPPSEAPAARRRFGMAYVGDAFIHGGCDRTGTTYFDDTWKRPSLDWEQLYPDTNPGEWMDVAMKNVHGGSYAILHGGYAGWENFTDRTWMWNGTEWEEVIVSSAQKPCARGMHAMAYDPVRNEFVIFGGYGNSEFLSDTWVLKAE